MSQLRLKWSSSGNSEEASCHILLQFSSSHTVTLEVMSSSVAKLGVQSLSMHMFNEMKSNYFSSIVTNAGVEGLSKQLLL